MRWVNVLSTVIKPSVWLNHLWGQAFICASHLAEHGSLTFKAPTVPTQLKVSGCDVFSAGRIDFENRQPIEDFEDIISE